MSDYIFYENALKIITNWIGIGDKYCLEEVSTKEKYEIIVPMIEYEYYLFYIKDSDKTFLNLAQDLNELKSEDRQKLRHKYVEIKILIRGELTGIEKFVDEQEIYSQFEPNFRQKEKYAKYIMRKIYV